MARVIFNFFILAIFISGHLGQTIKEHDANLKSKSTDAPTKTDGMSSVSQNIQTSKVPITAMEEKSSTIRPLVITEKAEPSTDGHTSNIIPEQPNTEPSAVPNTEPPAMPNTETTVEPDTPEPTTEEPSTTDIPVTTTAVPVTTTAVPVTTTAVPVMPSKHNYYNVTDGNVVCVMFIGEFSFNVNYNIEGNKTNNTVISLPKHTDSVMVEGSCTKKSSQWIKVSWGNGIPKTSMKIDFISINNHTAWSMSVIQAIIPMENSTFVNATDLGKSLNAVFNMTQLLIKAPYNESYACYAELNGKNGNVTMEKVVYKYPVTASLKQVQIQAFNEVPKVDSFIKVARCSEDKIADLVPIGVGCALAALIIFVLLAYAIGRRRRSLAYQSV